MLCLSAFLLGYAGPAKATLPGQNGPLLITAVTGESSDLEPALSSRIYLLGQNGRPNPLSPKGAFYGDPGISPDGRRIVFRKDPGEQLWLGPRTRPWNTRQITFTGPRNLAATDPTFAPDGKSIFFSSLQDVLSEDKLVWRLARYWIRSGKVQYLPGTFEMDTVPGLVVSPDGRRIAFNTGRQDESRIRIMPVNGGQGWELETGTAYVGDFSPDGARLVYTQVTDGNEELFVKALNGSKARQLTFDGVDKVLPRFSPDGTRIAYGMNVDEYTRIGILDLASGRTREIEAPGAYAAPWQWLRLRPFQIRGYARRGRVLRLTVFNPGLVTVFGRGIVRTRQRTGARRNLRIRVRWRPGVKRTILHVRFRPRGALPETRRLRVSAR